MPSGHITDWNSKRGFGFVESEGARIFVHWKDFSKRHKTPEVGDRIQFELGKDQEGRPCAQKAAHVNDGGRLTSENIFFLLFLIGAPTCAIVRLARFAPAAFFSGYALAISALTYFAYAWDKNRAKKKGRREPEQMLHLLELLGGWPGAFIAQRNLRHKCSKLSYQIVFWLIVAGYQFAAIDYLRDWRMTEQVTHEFKKILN